MHVNIYIQNAVWIMRTIKMCAYVCRQRFLFPWSHQETVYLLPVLNFFLVSIDPRLLRSTVFVFSAALSLAFGLSFTFLHSSGDTQTFTKRKLYLYLHFGYLSFHQQLAGHSSWYAFITILFSSPKHDKYYLSLYLIPDISTIIKFVNTD